MPSQELFTCAGVWRKSEEWGYVFSLIVAEASELVREIHDRMPVILPPKSRRQWFGSSDEAAALCKPFEGELIIDRTDQLWTQHH